MDKVLEHYYREGSLPEGVSKEELCEYILPRLFLRDKTVNLFDHGSITLKNISPFPIGDYGSDYAVVEAARVSLGKGIDTITRDDKLTCFLYDHKHMSPFEHITVTVRWCCPLPIARHVQRHRTFSYNEESARYCKVRDVWYIPEKFRAQSSSNRQCSTDEYVEDPTLTAEAASKCEEMYAFYLKLLERGVCREQARLYLPQAMYTSFIMTGNLRNWLHFIDLRSKSDAQWEIQQYTNAIKDLILPYIPLTAKAYKRSCEENS